ncbi:hypothetical protein DESPIGER_0017 [Desulfovibrio piger]|uniref:Uncharacterized protein n=1 Tax=Desulfovibrio piger TaxID=901 RepID=A0A1K1LB37_9BACT|nr:hypothetical protein DESPIGER_0017 [Desulfovibrio piger]
MHPAFGQDIVSRVTDILRNGVVQEGLAHLPDDVLLRSAHACSPRPGFWAGSVEKSQYNRFGSNITGITSMAIDARNL